MKSYPIPTDVKPLPISPHHGHAIKDSSGIKGWVYKILPRHVLLPLRDELFCSWLRFKTRNSHKRFLNEDNILLNVGSGSQGKTEWINIDLFEGKNVTIQYDCRHKLPFPDKSVTYLFTEHFLEHIDCTEDIPFFLTECRRVLKSSGVIRIVVPDAKKYLDAYFKKSWVELSDISNNINEDGYDTYFESRYGTLLQAVNHHFRQGHHHKYAYDFETLKYTLEFYGFNEVIQQQYQESYMPQFCIDAEERAGESLYVEARPNK